MYDVRLKKKAEKNLKNLPASVQRKLRDLLIDLEKGPVRGNWPNYSKLVGNKHHCHLAPSWVACWENKQGTIIIEVYYAGSRENAPY